MNAKHSLVLVVPVLLDGGINPKAGESQLYLQSNNTYLNMLNIFVSTDIKDKTSKRILTQNIPLLAFTLNSDNLNRIKLQIGCHGSLEVICFKS